VKKSVTIEPSVLERLSRKRRANLSATVNESLRLLAALDAQRSLVEEWEAEHGAFTEDELRPYLEVVLEAEAEAELARPAAGRRRTRSDG
jgi:transposase